MVTSQEIKKIAALAKLHVADEEIVSLTKEMSEIIKFADEVSLAAATADITELEADEGEALREDITEPSMDSETILMNSSLSGNGFFVVKDKAGKLYE